MYLMPGPGDRSGDKQVLCLPTQNSFLPEDETESKYRLGVSDGELSQEQSPEFCQTMGRLL